ncbi:hypothetical protein L1887_56951 [Cichorium endivia]|nr:hypothetical protein L1887_56951 [Cichorium endivia]
MTRACSSQLLPSIARSLLVHPEHGPSWRQQPHIGARFLFISPSPTATQYSVRKAENLNAKKGDSKRPSLPSRQNKEEKKDGKKAKRNPELSTPVGFEPTQAEPIS